MSEGIFNALNLWYQVLFMFQHQAACSLDVEPASKPLVQFSPVIDDRSPSQKDLLGYLTSVDVYEWTWTGSLTE